MLHFGLGIFFRILCVYCIEVTFDIRHDYRSENSLQCLVDKAHSKVFGNCINKCFAIPNCNSLNYIKRNGTCILLSVIEKSLCKTSGDDSTWYAEKRTQVPREIYYENLCASVTPIGSAFVNENPQFTVNQAIAGTPLLEIQVCSLSECVCQCKAFLKCLFATFLRTGICQLHSTLSHNGIKADNQAVIIDLNLSNLMRLLLFQGYTDENKLSNRLMIVIPEIPYHELLNQHMTFARKKVAAAVDGNDLIVRGGSSDLNEQLEIASGVPLSGFTIGVAEPQHLVNRVNGCSFRIGDSLYHCGGENSGVNELHMDCTVINLVTKLHMSLSLTASVHPGRMSPSCASLGSDFYYIGGTLGSSNTVGTTTRVDSTTGNVIDVANHPHRMIGAAAVVSNGKIFVCGGYSYQIGVTKLCHIYDPLMNTWTNLGQMIKARFHLSMINWGGGRILAFGGSSTGSFNDPSGARRDIEIYEKGTWRHFMDLNAGVFSSTVIDIDG